MQHDWPVDGVETYDFFTNHVHVSWPVFLKQAVVIAAIAQCRNIVGQGIDPDINDVLRVIWYLNTPVKRGPRNGQIFQTRFQEVFEHFVHPRMRLDKVRVFLVVVHQPVRVLAHLKEVGFFFDQFHLMARWCLTANHVAGFVMVDLSQLTFRKVFFIVNRIPANVFTFVNVALVNKLLKNLLHGFFMIVIRGPNKLIIGDFQFFPQFFNAGCHLVNVGLGFHPQFFSFFFNLETVFVSPRQEENVIAIQTLKAGFSVTGNFGVGIPNVQFARWIINRCCDVISWFLFSHVGPSF